MAATTVLVTWAREEAARLRTAAERLFMPDPRELTVRAMQFFSDHAPGSTFQSVAQGALDRFYKTAFATAWPVIKGVALQLEEWATYQESGISKVKPFEVQFRIEAASDVMDQVRVLGKDQEVHPAAPVMLAGAALEEALRSWYVEIGAPDLDGRPSIVSYAQALRRATVLSLTEFKEIDALAALRNDAAHGRFDRVTRQEAERMIDGVNRFILRQSQ